MEELPPLQSFAAQLKDCRDRKDLGHGRHVLTTLCYHGLDLNPSIANHIVPMLVDCGAFHHAKLIFSRSPVKNEHSWSSSIRACIEQNEPHSAFDLYEQMQEEGVAPTPFTLVPLLQACGMLRWSQQARILHSEAICKGFDRGSDVVLGNSLIDAYVKCGMLAESHNAFGHMPGTDLISWNTLIAGYAEAGLSEEAVSCYEQMLIAEVRPDAYTFVCMLKVCADNGWIELGRSIHAKVVEEIAEESIFVGSALVEMYARCSTSSEEAWQVFDEASEHDVVLWTSLMAMHVEHDLADEALACVELMMLEGLRLDGIALACCLKACGTSGEHMIKGKEMHGWAAKLGLDTDTVVGNSLIYMYARCGSLPDSVGAFEKLRARDAISWTSLIGGYVECGLAAEALEGFECMQFEGISPEPITYVLALRACRELAEADRGRSIHAELTNKGLEGEAAISGALLDLYRHLDAVSEALYMFQSSRTREASKWEALISMYAHQGRCEEALVYLEAMEREGLAPSPTAYTACLSDGSNIRHEDRRLCDSICGSIFKKGFERDLVVATALVSHYATSGSIEELENVFGVIPTRDAITWNALIRGYVEHGNPEEALGCTYAMQQEGIPPDAVSWNMVFAGFLEQEEIRHLRALMEAQGAPPDGVVFTTLLRACGNDHGTLEAGKRIHAQISGEEGTISMHGCCDAELITTVIDMYGKCGSMREAQNLFDASRSMLPIRWNALMMGYARQGASQTVLDCLHKMGKERIQPDELTFLSVLTACSHSGSIKTAHMCLRLMIESFGFLPTIKHFYSLIDLLGRAGRVDEAIKSSEKIHPQPELMIQDMLVYSCQNPEDMELNRRFLDYALMTISPHCFEPLLDAG